MRRYLLFAGFLVVVVMGGAWLITWLAPGHDVARAVWTSAVIAVVVQGVGFAFARSLQPANMVVGWGAVVLLRALAFVIYALVVLKAAGLAPAPALLSLAAFFFVTSLVEPILLKP